MIKHFDSNDLTGLELKEITSYEQKYFRERNNRSCEVSTA